MVALPEADENLENSNKSAALSHMEPIFWGTSELLFWESDKLLEALAYECQKREATGGKAAEIAGLSSDSYAKALSLLPENCLEPSGIYGYFPVITEHGSLVILDPADFHSEMAIITPQPHYSNVVASCINEADVVAMFGVTLGFGFSRLLSQLKSATTSPDEYRLLHELGVALVAILNKRCAIEARRGLEIEDTAGTHLSALSIVNNTGTIPSLCTVMGTEERLGVTISSHGKVEPEYADFSILFPRATPSDTKK